jgi:iron-sulfur cluster assembly accessory protein
MFQTSRLFWAKVSLTRSAVNRLRWLEETTQESRFLKISVIPGGCNGFLYNLELVSSRECPPHATVIHQEGATVVYDSTSADLLDQCTIDFEENMIGSRFQVIFNKRSTSKCGCGSSFNIGF